MQAFMAFNEGILRMPMHWQVWVMLLVIMNLVLPIFFSRNRFEARVVVGVFLVGAALMMFLTAMTGFTRLLGLGHIFWFPLLYFLWTRLDRIPGSDGYGRWVRGLMAINAMSLVLDVLDVLRYVGGERQVL